MNKSFKFKYKILDIQYLKDIQSYRAQLNPYTVIKTALINPFSMEINILCIIRMNNLDFRNKILLKMFNQIIYKKIIKMFINNHICQWLR
jgi:hypothetical protein